MISPICFHRPGAREEPPVQQAQRRSAVFLSFKSPIPCLPLRWEQQSKLLPTVAGIPASKVSKWSTDEVSEFIQSLPGCEEHGKVFKDEVSVPLNCSMHRNGIKALKCSEE